MPRPGLRASIDTGRRRAEAAADRAWAVARHRFGPLPRVAPFDDDVRFAIVTVNASTTRYLKLMLATLAEQRQLGLVQRLVIVDQRSGDGGPPFLRSLAEAAPRVDMVELRSFLNHARGMRAGMHALDRVERDVATGARANVLLFVDPDVVFRNPDALGDLATSMLAFDAVLAGEVRQLPGNPHPNIQASFLAIRRDVTARRDISPFVNGGAPAFLLQRDVARAGLSIADFPTNRRGFALHRGRAAVQATHRYTPRRSYASVAEHEPHYMNVPHGARIWDEIETRHAAMLTVDAEPELVTRLAGSFEGFGTSTELPR
jgi:hypothetical protein